MPHDTMTTFNLAFYVYSYRNGREETPNTFKQECGTQGPSYDFPVVKVKSTEYRINRFETK